MVVLYAMFKLFSDKSEFGKYYDSSIGLPPIVYFLVFAFVMYIAFRVYLSVRKDKKTGNNTDDAKEEHRGNFLADLQKLHLKK